MTPQRRKRCGAAGDIAFSGSEEVILKPINKSPRLILNSLIESGVTVQVCSLYLPNKGISAAELIEGVTQAKSPLVAKMLLEHGVKVVTFLNYNAPCSTRSLSQDR